MDGLTKLCTASNQKPGAFADDHRTTPTAMTDRHRFFACLFVPDFPVEAVLRAEPDLRVQPLAVLEGKPPLQKVLGVNDKARRLGIEPGMTKIQVEPCTQLVLRTRSPLLETAAHAALLDCAQSFSPRVEDTAPDTVLLDLAGLETLFGSPARIARDLARRASDLGLEAHVAAAANPDTARLAARGFSGVTVIPEGQEAERLGNLSLDVLFPERTSAPAAIADLPAQPAQPKSPHNALSSAKVAAAQKDETAEAARFLETFDLWGVRNLRALAALPDVALAQRLGQAGLRLQQLARGATERTLVSADLPLVFEEALDLEYPIVLLEPLAFVLARLLDQLCSRLAARALAAQELRLKLELDTGFHFVEDIPEECAAEDTSTTQAGPPSRQGAPGRRHFTRTLHLPVPMLDPKTFLKLLQLDLKAHPPGAPILKMHLAAEPARPRTAQGGLFQPPAPEPEKLELTLARIAGMVGPENVGGIALLDTHRPEAFRLQRFAPAANENEHNPLKRKKTAADPAVTDRAAPAPITALRMFRPPLHATVTLRDGKPMRLVCARRKEISGDILWMAGPWRSSGDWWDRDGWSRDEWDIALLLPVASYPLSVGKGQLWLSRTSSATPALALYRLVHDLMNRRWFVEGTYD
jgi:protein ImuB